MQLTGITVQPFRPEAVLIKEMLKGSSLINR